MLWTEVEKHKPRLLSETKLPADEFEEALEFLNEEIDIVPFGEFIGLLPEAENICPDPKDKQYFALALAFGCGIFSGDPPLKKQSAIRVFSPRELLNILLSKTAP